ncbi:hypothetical protein BT96DRAFT_933786 [Gymnopus androsaceus JB14]|uniref:Uncharacterized protein n=1 Tax=Gymnopus androsaceus JB14 TaxID=1447944 RepID=A0A6A4IC41_9AGAR|nr:hypothetical protein BT96DRAFT_933786 [Gymnopus androsaceus JB14]
MPEDEVQAMTRRAIGLYFERGNEIGSPGGCEGCQGMLPYSVNVEFMKFWCLFKDIQLISIEHEWIPKAFKKKKIQATVNKILDFAITIILKVPPMLGMLKKKVEIKRVAIPS